MNRGVRAKFSGSAQILESSSAELPRGSEFKLSWEGIADLEADIGQDDFRLLLIAQTKAHIIKRSLFQYKFTDPMVKEMPLPSLRAGKILAIGALDGGGKRVVWKAGDETIRLTLRIRLSSDPPSARQTSRIIRLVFDGETLTVV
jgi:hypothetical protein